MHSCKLEETIVIIGRLYNWNLKKERNQYFQECGMKIHNGIKKAQLLF